ncbi:TetR/AcrR family transcriptional regulator [Amycolatopsis sp. NPDC059657]|uniref:TetR/AcrR family transcriptional regulator n=1 Tax=Amycolatopsis sp. NPDC059657 TaxID=3346899 RepID=UPI00366F8A02
MPEERPLRRDAQRNRELLVVAAREIFGTKGLDAPLEEIARRAGVAIGTLYNRFPTRVDLVEAAFLPQLDQVAQTGAQALAFEDPWEGLVFFVESGCARQATDQGFAEVCAGRIDAPALEAAKTAIWDTVSELVARAQDAARLRQDFKPEDLLQAIAATSSIPEWRRHLSFFLDGIRAK